MLADALLINPPVQSDPSGPSGLHGQSKSWKKSWAWLELTAEQRSQPWFDARRCCVTGSVARKSMDFSGVCKTDKAEIVKEIRGVLPPTLVNVDMQRGIDNEDPLRRLFMSKVLPDKRCYEPSLCMGTTVYDFPFASGKLLSEVYGDMKTNPYHPQWFVGASPDGIILDGVTGQPVADLECKVPEYCYPDMVPDSKKMRHPHEHWMRSKFAYLFDEDEVNWAIDNDYPNNYFMVESNLKLDHFCQVYGQLANTDLKHAYYLVGFTKLADAHRDRLGPDFYFPPTPAGLAAPARTAGTVDDVTSSLYDVNLSVPLGTVGDGDQSFDYPLGFSYCEMDFEQRTWQSKLYPQLVDFVVNHLIPDMTAEEKVKHENKVKELSSLCKPDDYVLVPWCY